MFFLYLNFPSLQFSSLLSLFIIALSLCRCINICVFSHSMTLRMQCTPYTFCNENIYLSIIMWMEFCFLTHFFQFLSLESIRILNYFACFFRSFSQRAQCASQKKNAIVFFRDVVLLIEAIIFIIIALGRNYSSQQIKAHMCIKSNGNLFPFL